jgi:hypothetical protein
MRARLSRIAVVGIVAAFAIGALLLARSGCPAWAQETDLPGSVADSTVNGTPEAPGTPAIPASPPGTGLDRTDLQEIRRHIHAGDNDVVKVGQDIIIDTNDHVLGHVFAMGGNVIVRGQVDDDVVAMGGNVTLEDGAQVHGDVVSLGGQVHKSRAATVLGTTATVGGFPPGLFHPRTLWALGGGVQIVSSLVNLGVWLLVAWIVVSLFPARSRRVLDDLRGRFGPSFVWGLVGFIAIVPALIGVVLVAVLLCVTIIGIPVGVLLILGYCLAVVALIFWGGLLGASAVGEWTIVRLSPRLGQPSLVRNTLIGIVVVTLPGLIGGFFMVLGLAVPPAVVLGGALRVLGKVLQFVILLAGMGAVLHARGGQVGPVRMPWSGPSPTPVPPAPPGSPPPAPPMPPPALPGAAESIPS